jgi:hypothetical protein
MFKKKLVDKRRNELYSLFELMDAEPYSAKFAVSQLLAYDDWSEHAKPLKWEEITYLSDKMLLKSYDLILRRMFKTTLEEINKKEYSFIDEKSIRRKFII